MSAGRRDADAVDEDDAALVPGGILESDHAHDGLDAFLDEIFLGGGDQTCSRCRRAVEGDETTLRCWADGGTVVWIYCDDCSEFGELGADAA